MTTPAAHTKAQAAFELREAVSELTHSLVVEGTASMEDENAVMEGLLRELILGADDATIKRVLTIHKRDLEQGEYDDLDGPEKGTTHQYNEMVNQTQSLTEQLDTMTASPDH